MKVLLIAMPDTVSSLDQIMQIPNLGLCSLAGSIEDAEVKVLDLVMHKRKIRSYLLRILSDYAPDIVGISAMSFQYGSAKRTAGIVRDFNPEIYIVLGGYHATLLSEEICGKDGNLFHFLIRGEGEASFNALVRELRDGRANFSSIPGLSYRTADKPGTEGYTFHHNPPAPLADLETLKPPRRDCRIIKKNNFMRLKFDCAETSRGCTMGCNFCSITKMYGRTYRKFPLERVIMDLKNAKDNGAQGLFFVDDNITLDVKRLKQLCGMIIDEGLNTMYYAIQASVPGIASDGELAALLKKAGFRWVFLGIESGIARNLEEMNKTGVLENTAAAVKLLRDEGLCVLGGFIIGYPDDSRMDIKETYRYAGKIGVDHAIVQCLTPYPKTEIRDQLIESGLVTNPENWDAYNGFRVNIRTNHLSADELTKWMILYGLKLYFNPKYILRSRVWWYQPGNAPQMLLNNFIFAIDGLKGKLFYSRHTW